MKRLKTEMRTMDAALQGIARQDKATGLLLMESFSGFPRIPEFTGKDEVKETRVSLAQVWIEIRQMKSKPLGDISGGGKFKEEGGQLGHEFC
nr:hypothetical protein [Tanacetum cinerariifolium]